MPRYAYEPFEYVTPPEISSGKMGEYRVAIIGAGPIGVAMAIDLALQGIPSVVLDDNNVVSIGSRAICWAKRSLEIFDRMGIGKRMLEKGVTWKIGRLFHGDDEVYSFDLLAQEGHQYPAFINLQQYYVEQYLVERAQEFPDLIDLRFKNKVVSHTALKDGIELDVETPDGDYHLRADYCLACDGAGSATRKRMNLPFEGQSFEEHFLIVDVEMEENPFDRTGEGADVPERWFWFEPSFHPGQSALLHRQPDNIYRIDLQLGPEADPKVEASEERVLPRIRAIVGDKPFKLDWMSVYKFRCAMLDRFVHGRMIFVGDSAHVVSPFGARGGNGGIQDVDNLGWKLAAVLNGRADADLLETYNEERHQAALENILNSSRATNFMTPKSELEQRFRSQVLNLSKSTPFARTLINSGRLSLPCAYHRADGAKVNTKLPDFAAPGRPVVDAPVGNGWLLDHVGGEFTLLSFDGQDNDALDEYCHTQTEGTDVCHVGLSCKGNDLLKARYLGDASSAIYLIRPDQHVAARWETFDAKTIKDAVLQSLTNHAPAMSGAA